MFVLLETVQRVSQPSSVFLGFKYMFACCNVSLAEWVRRRTDRFSAIYPFYLEKICYSREVVGLLLCAWRWWCDIERDENKNLFSTTTSNVMLIIHISYHLYNFFLLFRRKMKKDTFILLKKVEEKYGCNMYLGLPKDWECTLHLTHMSEWKSWNFFQIIISSTFNILCFWHPLDNFLQKKMRTDTETRME